MNPLNTSPVQLLTCNQLWPMTKWITNRGLEHAEYYCNIDVSNYSKAI